MPQNESQGRTPTVLVGSLYPSRPCSHSYQFPLRMSFIKQLKLLLTKTRPLSTNLNTVWRNGTRACSTSDVGHGTTGVSGKERSETEPWAELVPFRGVFRWNKWQTTVSQTCMFDIFLKIKWSWQVTIFVANYEIQGFQWKSGLWKYCISHYQFESFQFLKTFVLSLVMVLTNVIFFMSQHLGELHKLVSQYFPSDQCMILYPKYDDDQWILENTESSLTWFQISNF